ncbi:MAG: cold shock domain-containing protein [Candidatus Marinimicrobia bacterium]|nr:cold shock domain-containing protein [Candidatus Neomarinimicrobiota bacterium]
MLETGVVKFFDGRDNKRYGFLRLDSGEEIFFHFNDGMSIKAGKCAPEWCDPPKGKRLWDPQANDLLVFERSEGNRGPKASPWTHWRLYDRVLKEIANRPIYRVIEQTSTTGSEPGESRQLWYGTDLEDPNLTKVWHPVHDRSFFAHDDGFEIRKWFEVNVQGEWLRTEDPRI